MEGNGINHWVTPPESPDLNSIEQVTVVCLNTCSDISTLPNLELKGRVILMAARKLNNFKGEGREFEPEVIKVS